MQPRQSTNNVPAEANRGSAATQLSNQKTDRLGNNAAAAMRTMKAIDAETPNVRARDEIT